MNKKKRLRQATETLPAFSHPAHEAIFDALRYIQESHRRLAKLPDLVQPKQRRKSIKSKVRALDPFCLISETNPAIGYWEQPVFPEEDYWPKDEYKPWIGRPSK
jgi:hypothetical protein